MVEIIIDRNKCEGKAVCLAACPENVFELKEPSPETLRLLSRIKLKFHGGKQAFAVRAENCTACGVCVKRCPEKAIIIRGIEEENHGARETA